MVVLAFRIRADESGVGHLHFASTRRAAPPFADFDEARIGVGS